MTFTFDEAWLHVFGDKGPTEAAIDYALCPDHPVTLLVWVKAAIADSLEDVVKYERGIVCGACMAHVAKMVQEIEDAIEKGMTAQNLLPDPVDASTYAPTTLDAMQYNADRLMEAHDREDELLEQIAKLKAALAWCGGSEDFAEGGKARAGWLAICAPLLKEKP